MGYLPETMRNYLLRLGWSHGDDETISTQQAIEWFDLESIGRAPPGCDFKKLDNLNGHYIRESGDESLAAEVVATLARETAARVGSTMTARQRLTEAMPGLKERAKTMLELAQSAEFLFTDGPSDPGRRSAKSCCRRRRAPCSPMSSPRCPRPMDRTSTGRGSAEAFAAAQGLKLGQVAQPLRAALTGKATSPPLFDMMALLGRDESLVRLAAYAAQ